MSNIPNSRRPYTNIYTDTVTVTADAAKVFAYLDDHVKFASHMNQSSMMTGGMKMITKLDEGEGKKIGSHITMRGTMLGLNLFLDEIVTYRESPHLKIWETVGDVRLLVIGHYRMVNEITPVTSNSCRFKVTIEYNLPETNPFLGRLFGKMYAKWCVQQMLNQARNHFSPARS